jgi:hypothetical protein
MIAGWVIILTALIYLSGLFALAHFGDIHGQKFRSGRSSATLYALTLAVYCTSWTFFGSVGLASNTGFDFLAIYIGPIVVIGFGHGFVERIVKLSKAQNIISIADFVAARYGKNGKVAALVALIAVIGSIPYIALQLKAISVSLRTILEATPGGVQGFSTPASGTLALIVTLVLAGFTTVFGTRTIDAREHHNGLTLAVAAESVVKLAAFLIVGVFVVWGMFDGPIPLVTAVAERTDIKPLFERSSGWTTVIAMTALSSAIILILPRQFHMTIVENRDPSDLQRAKWLFPLYLVLINIFVIPIALCADLIFPPGTLDRDMAILQLPLHAGDDVIALIVFIGGFSASTAMIIVECVALGTMVSNDLVMPLILRGEKKLSRPRSGDLGGQVLVVRRVAIILLLLAGYSYFRSTGEAALASIGLVSFAAIAQIAPAFFGGLFWRRGTALGASAGLITGFAVWTYTLALPNLADPARFGLDALLAHGPFGIEGLKPTNLFGFNLPFIAHGAFFSLVANLAAYFGFSMLRAPTPIERLQASLFVAPERSLRPFNFRRWRSSVTVGDLKRVVGRYLGVEQADRAFAGAIPTLTHETSDDRSADIEMLRFAEHQLASAIGAASSRRVMSMLLSGGNVSQAAALRLLDDASAALQYNRDLLQHALDHARQGITVFDRDLKLTCWNREFQHLFGLPDSMMRAGTTLDEIVTFNAKKGVYGPGRKDRLITARLESFVSEASPSRLRLFPDGRTVEFRSAPLPDGGIVTTYTDVTETVSAEEALASANESLEARVRERTEELLRLNSELSRAKAEAEDANLSKTRFLAAASHDILQPLNAARLYSSALLDRDQKQGDERLAENVATSLEAVEDILTTLLDISRLDAGAMKPEIMAFGLDELLSQLKVELEPMAKEKGIELRFAKTSLAVRSDRRLLRRLLQNLISNAIKYTPEGRVLVGCRRKKGKIRIEIHDTGLGIPLSQQKAIFREFKRLDEGARVARGLGLGLSIVERIARLLRHPLKLVSEPGRGSLFSVELPLADPVAKAKAIPLGTPTLSTPLVGMSVLAIDNEPAILDGMKILLEGWGCAVVTLAGLDNLASIRVRPDVVIADFHLGEGTGLDAIGALRGKFGTDLQAVLITADRTLAVRDAAESASITVMHKPLKPAALRALLAQWRAAQPREIETA